MTQESAVRSITHERFCKCKMGGGIDKVEGNFTKMIFFEHLTWSPSRIYE
jgi:hypothetical protein